MISLTKNLATIAMAASLAGCATVDFDLPKESSVMLQPADTAETWLGKELSNVADAHPEGESGFLPISDGIEALSVRLLMAERAERSIDAQ